MKLKDLHKDIERYLQEDCYCPNEIYDLSGFFYELFYADSECKLLGERKEFIICLEKQNKENNQVLLFWKSDDENKITDSTRFDATENNLKIVKEHLLIDNPVKTYHFDEFIRNNTKNQLDKILGIVNGIMMD